MAIIPNDEKFIGLSASVDTTERRSALINAESQAYTMQDITDTVSATIPAPVNPTSGYYPINKNGVFVNSGLSNTVAVLPPFLPGGSLGLKYYDEFSGKTLLELNPMDLSYTFGNAFYDQFGVVASGGLAISEPMGQMVMGCGISAGTEGVFKANAVTGVIEIGTSAIRKFGIDLFAGAIRVTSGFNSVSGPSNTASPVTWTRVTDESGILYWYPLYQ